MAGYFTIILMLILVNCSNEPYREFNSDDTQDPECYGNYGGQYGYCDARRDFRI